MEDSNLTENNIAQQNGTIIPANRSTYKLSNKTYENSEPPDGGARAWLVVISAFLCNSILFGVINTYGIIYLTLQEKLTSHGDPDASSKAGRTIILIIYIHHVAQSAVIFFFHFIIIYYFTYMLVLMYYIPTYQQHMYT